MIVVNAISHKPTLLEAIKEDYLQKYFWIVGSAQKTNFTIQQYDLLGDNKKPADLISIYFRITFKWLQKFSFIPS